MSWLFRYDVFISYSHADQQWVEQLAHDLKSEFRVFFDKWELVPDLQRPLDEQIENALRKSSAGIYVLSPDAVNSKWVKYELSKLTKRCWGRRRPLIPVLYKDTPTLLWKEDLLYVDFRDDSPEARKKALEILRKALRGQPPGLAAKASDIPKVRWWQHPQFSLKAVLTTSLLLLVFVLLLFKGILVTIQNESTITRLRRIQREVQEIESRASINTNPTDAVFDGKRDSWTNGKLTQRNFYQGGRLIAMDSFHYAGTTVVEKVRSYLDNSQRVFFIDYFTQDGMLAQKRYCPEGPERPCVVYADEMRSPLPPSWAMVYR